MVFALDVGTRKVAGLIADRDDDKVKVYDIEITEHEKRAMIDGAIHDVEKVARAVEKVKKSLEDRNEIELKKVAIALAGRFLRTITTEAQLDVSGLAEIDPEDVLSLEMSAVSKAMENVNPDEMFCVGYSVLSYELDGAWMMKLEGHRGKTAKVKVISAFLPVQVVDAMNAVLKRVGLEMAHMTLEPIAAIEVAVPDEVRLLNVALVDVGAGTSDIAISNDGAVVAYGMVPKAGDEITEAISKNFLLDFNVAEFIKRNIGNTEIFKVKDILDNEREVTAEEILEVIDPVVDDITSEVASAIVELNGGSPKAVMVVGGGARVPGFIEKLREKLDLPVGRVSLKGVENLPNIEDYTGRLSGSDLVTPVGIAKSALFGKGGIFSKVYVNGVPIKLIGLSGKYTVMQVLLQAGYDMKDVIGRLSPSIVYEVNGKVRSFKKGRERVIIKVNGEEATTRTVVSHNDRITLEKIVEEQSKIPRVRDVVEKVKVKIDNRIVEIVPEVFVNGEIADPNSEIKDGDKIDYNTLVPVKKIRNDLSKGFIVYVNDEPKMVKSDVKLFLNGRELSDDDFVRVGEEIEATFVSHPKVKDIIPEGESITVKFNGQLLRIPVVEYEVMSDGKMLSLDDEISDGMKILVSTKKVVPIVATVLSMVELPPMRKYKILKNGREASFAEPVMDGDEIKLVEY